MCVGVWEWTSTAYDALAYRGQATPKAADHYVIRGGSWADCAESVTVSFRSSRPAVNQPNPNQGLRVCLPAPPRGILDKFRHSLQKWGQK